MIRENKGSALIMAIVLIAVLGISNAALWKYLHVTLAQQARQERSEIAQHLAEAGLERAVALLRVDGEYRGEQGTELGAGVFSVAVERTAAPRGYRIVSTGEITYEGATLAKRVLEAALLLSTDGAVQGYHWRAVEKQEWKNL